MKFLDEEDAIKSKQKLDEEMIIDPTDETKEYTSTNINWVDNVNTWWEAKSMALTAMSESLEERNIFIAHDNDIIKGKPQLIHQSLKNITLMRRVLKVTKDKQGDDSKYEKSWRFLDDSFDRRYDGNLVDEWSKDFLIYRITTLDKKEYYILSNKELPLQGCELRGMIVEIKDFTEVSKSMKMKGFSKVFFLKDFIPDVKILEKEEIVSFTKEREINEEKWFKFLGSHELGTTNRFPKEVELLRSAQLLSSKVDGWPLHLGIIGPPGSRKSMGHIETIAWKFSEEAEIIEGGNSRIKGLSPSFKEKPANIGYLARCERLGWIDELGKMVEFESNKHQSIVRNVLGELNFLLDHKRRTVGSGNDNDCVVQAIGKFVFVTNPVSGKSTIYEHVGIIDPTTMSRILWWVQGKEEQEFVLGSAGVVRIPPTPKQDYKPKEKEKSIKYCVGVGGIGNASLTSKMGLPFPVEQFPQETHPFILINREEFLTIYDTLNSFLCQISDEKVAKIHGYIVQMAKEPMKSVWKPRGEHHIKLLIDGICKHRCLFRDYDSSFEVTEDDYEEAKSLLFKMVKNWDTNLSIKHEPNWEKGLIEDG